MTQLKCFRLEKGENKTGLEKLCKYMWGRICKIHVLLAIVPLKRAN